MALKVPCEHTTLEGASRTKVSNTLLIELIICTFKSKCHMNN